MIFKRTILTKILNNGMKVEFALVQEDRMFQAALYVNGRHINGPALPELLDPPKGEVTHWMGNRPSVGLTQAEAEKIISEVDKENSVIAHRNTYID